MIFWRGCCQRSKVSSPAAVRLSAEGTPFLGFVLRPHERRLKSRNAVAATRRFRALNLRAEQHPEEWDALLRSVRGWVAHAKHGSTYGLRVRVMQKVYKQPDQT